MNNVLFALALTTFAGLATGVGSIIAFAAKRTNYRFLSVATGFSAGVMLYVSFVDIFPTAFEEISQRYGGNLAHWINTASFFAGMLFIGIIDYLIPEKENPHEAPSEEEAKPLHRPRADEPVSETEKTDHNSKLLRMGIFTALAIGIHNFPEGIATFFAALQNPKLGVAIAIAIALHNIPEGISVSVPIYYATGNRKKAFCLSFLSGLAEPIGAGFAFLVAYLITGTTTIPMHVTGIMFSAIAGIMVFISLDELLPTSRAYGKGHDSLTGLIAGMMTMALSILMLK